MDQIRQAALELERAHKNLEVAVTAERARGRSWADIGRTLGVSRQAAFKRFGKINTPEGDTLMPRPVNHLKQTAQQFFTLVSEGQEDLAMAMLNPNVREELNWDVISQVWQTCLEEAGTLERFSDTFITHPQGTSAIAQAGEPEQILGTAVVVTTLEQEAGSTTGRIAFDGDDLITGILYLNPEAPLDPLPF